jgi:hypothetical protein
MGDLSRARWRQRRMTIETNDIRTNRDEEGSYDLTIANNHTSDRT